MKRLRTLAVIPLALASVGCLANADNTGPAEGEETCDITATGEYLVNVDNTVVDGLCLNGGVLLIQADNVEVRNSQITGAPPDYFVPVALLAGSDNVNVHHNLIDCGGDTAPENAASQGVRALDGQTSGVVSNNEIRDCSDGIQAASNTRYAFNWVRLPDNSGDLHADGVQWDTENDGSPIHDVLFEWNTIDFPVASAAFQWHNSQVESEGPYNIVVRYNSFHGGGYVMRLPNFGGGGNEFYGNRLSNSSVPPEFGLCTPIDNGTAPIDVWGRETGDTTNSLGDTTILDDDNVAVANGSQSILERADCE